MSTRKKYEVGIDVKLVCENGIFDDSMVVAQIQECMVFPEKKHVKSRLSRRLREHFASEIFDADAGVNEFLDRCGQDPVELELDGAPEDDETYTLEGSIGIVEVVVASDDVTSQILS